MNPGSSEFPVSRPASSPVPDAFASVLADVERVVAEGGDLGGFGGSSGSPVLSQAVSCEIGCQTDARDAAVVLAVESTRGGTSVASEAVNIEPDAQSEPDLAEIRGSFGSSRGDFIPRTFGESSGTEDKEVDVVGVSASPDPPPGSLHASRSCDFTAI